MLSRFIQEIGVSSGWLTLAAVGIAVISYCLGCLNGAVTVSKYILRDDVRDYGSGNGGLTNFCRVHGGPLTILVVLADVLKAVVAVLFAAWLAECISPDLVAVSKYWAGLFCLLGHMFPFNYQFRGGKGVLSGGIVAILVDWRVALVVWGGFLILALVTKIVSLGALWAGVTFPIASYFVFKHPLITILSVIAGLLLVVKHHANIKRLITGKEPKFSFKRNPPPKNTVDPQQEQPEHEEPKQEQPVQEQPEQDTDREVPVEEEP